MDYDPSKPGPIKEPTTFERGLEDLINRYSQENGSNTPDFILAHYLTSCLAIWNACVTQREEWYGRSGRSPATIEQQEQLNKTVTDRWRLNHPVKLAVTDGRMVCPKCGEKADLIAAAADAEAPQDVWECPSCGEQFSILK